MAKKQQRMELILDYLLANQAAGVKELADLSEVTEMTIRRDLAELNNGRKIKFIQGVAININNYLDNEYSLDIEQNTNTLEKQKIGRVAAGLIEADDIVFMDSGTTVGYIFEELKSNLPLTIITNYLRHISRASKNVNWNLIVPGGTLQRKSMTLLNNEKKGYLSGLRVNKAFISATGISRKLGVTCPYLEECDIKSSAIEYSDKTYLVVDHSKFDRVSIGHVSNLEHFDYVITDDKIPSEYIDFLESINVKPIVV